MGSSPSRTAADDALRKRRRLSSSGSVKQYEATDIERSTSGIASQLRRKASITAEKLEMAKMREKTAARQILLDEFPDLADSFSYLKKLMNELDDNSTDDIDAKTMSLSSKKNLEELLDLFFKHEPTEHKRILGDEIADNNGGKIFTEYMRALSPMDCENSTDECLGLLKSVCWNYSDASSEFSIALGRAGTFQVLVDEIKSNADDLGDNYERYGIILQSVSVLHNCAKSSDSKVYMDEANVLDALVPLLKAEIPEIKIIATLTLAYIIEEKDNVIISTDNTVIKFIRRYLRKAIKSQDHKYDGFRVEEIVSGLMRLASNDQNKEAIVNQDVLPLLRELLDIENQRKIRECAGLMDALRKLSMTDGQWKPSAIGAIWVLEEEQRLNKANAEKIIQSMPSPLPTRLPPLHPASKQRKKKISVAANMAGSISMAPGLVQSKIELPPHAQQEEYDSDDDMHTPRIPMSDMKVMGGEKEYGKNETNEYDSSGQHIMISYQWDYQKLMIRVKDEFESLGYRVWIDVESMGGSTLQAMADAVEKSAIVLLCMSRKYKESPNCRTEAEYAYKLEKTLIPLKVEKSYEPDGWLGALQGAKLYFDFSDLVQFETVFRKLTKEIGTRAKIPPEPKEEPIIPVKQTDLANPARPLVKNWTSKEVKDWVSINNVHMKNLSSIDGQILLFLKNLKDTAPEFYYRFLHDRLGMTELRSLMNLNNALEALIE